MKSMKKISYLLLIAIVAVSGFIFTSCKKETTETNMIIRRWTLESMTIAGLNVATDCQKLAVWNFKSDGTYAIYDSCNKTLTGTWKLAADAKTLTLDNITAYAVIESTLGKLVIEMQVGSIGLTQWSFN
jgi:heat shock protein HslJ